MRRDPISKIIKAKWTGGVAQEVEHLFCKCKALSSNLVPQKKKKIPVAFGGYSVDGLE
jgi:hypothetical protein